MSWLRNFRGLAGSSECVGEKLSFRRVDARACGGTVVAQHREGLAVGLSPRLRGNHDAIDLGPVVNRSIPAPAGKGRAKRYISQRSFQIEQKERAKPNRKKPTAKRKKTAKLPNPKSPNKSTSAPKPRVRDNADQEANRKEYRRLWGQTSRHEAKKNGLCTQCKMNLPITGQTRCQECAKKHRAYREKAMQNPEAREKERVRQKQSRERSKDANGDTG